MEIIYNVISTKIHHETRLKSLVNTWGSELKNLNIFTDDNIITKNGNIILCNINDYLHYNIPLYQKHTISKLKKILLYNENKEFDFLVITDDDTFINVTKLENLLTQYNSNENIIIGKIIDSHPSIKNINYFSGGAGIVISKEAFKKILNKINIFENKNYIESFIWSDVLLGFLINQTEIKKINNNLFNTGSENKENDFITLHYLDFNLFYEVYENNKF